MEEDVSIPKTFFPRLQATFIGRKDNREVRTFQLDVTQPGRLINGVLNVILGPFMMGLAIYLAILLYRTYHEFYWPTVIYLLFGGGLTALGLWTLRLHRRISRLSSVKETCIRFGISESALRSLAEECGVKPKLNIGGQDYYNLADLGDVSTLLRASGAPGSSQETLLRPAAQTETPPELLLRATQAASAGEERN